jgi:hypothetical protein
MAFLARTFTLIAAGLIAGTAAQAQDRAVTVVNETAFTIVSFFGSGSSAQDWGSDKLAGDPLAPGAERLIDFNDGSGLCFYDLRAVFEDGDESVREGLDICAGVSRFVLN